MKAPCRPAVRCRADNVTARQAEISLADPGAALKDGNRHSDQRQNTWRQEVRIADTLGRMTPWTRAMTLPNSSNYSTA